MDRLIGQHMLRLDPKEARDMIDLFLIENKQHNYTFEVSCVFSTYCTFLCIVIEIAI